MNFIQSSGDNRGMKEPPGYYVPDLTDYALSDSGGGSGYFFSTTRTLPEDSPLRYYFNRACLFLQKGIAPEKTAAHLGFTDYENFALQFRDYTGVSPGEYRNWIIRKKYPPD